MAIGSRSDAVDASDLDLKELALEGLQVARTSFYALPTTGLQ